MATDNLTITARSNGQYRQLYELWHDNRARRQSGEFVVLGAEYVARYLKSGWELRRLYGAGQSGRGDIARQAKLLGAAVDKLFSVPEVLLHSDLFAHLTGRANAPKVLAVFAQRVEREDLPSAGLSFGLDGVADPRNLGLLVRSAAAFGIENLILRGGVDPFHPEAQAAAVGAGSNLQIYTWKNEATPWEHAAWTSLTHIATVLDPEAETLTKLSPQLPAVIWLGNEAQGISAELLAHCQQKLYIPHSAEVESLNVAMAATVIAYHLSVSR